jgi:hypothetical protein
VLYINFELARPFIYSRIKRLCETKEEQKVETDLSNLDVWNLRGKAAPLGDLVPELVSQIKNGGYSLVIIDPIYKGLGGRDENAAGDIGELCNELERIAVETGAAVFYVAHFSKGNQAGKEAMDRISGSGVWTRDADSIITLTKHKEEQDNAYTVDLTLRNFPEQPSFVVAWNFPLMTMRVNLNPEDLRQARGRKAAYEEEDLLNVLGQDRLSTTEWQQRAKEEGISQSGFYRLYKLLQKSRQIEKGDDGKWEHHPLVKVTVEGDEAPSKETEKVSQGPLGRNSGECQKANNEPLSVIPKASPTTIPFAGNPNGHANRFQKVKTDNNNGEHFTAN